MIFYSRGQPFRWLLENVPGWIIYLMVGIEKDTPKKDNQMDNKAALKKYVGMFPIFVSAVEDRRIKEQSKPKLKVVCKYLNNNIYFLIVEKYIYSRDK